MNKRWAAPVALATIAALGMGCMPIAQAGIAQAGAGDLFFSEYVEGSGNNKALEIYNGTGTDVELSAYTIELYSNGNPAPNSTATLAGTLVDGDVFVVSNSQADPPIQAVSDMTSGVASFNGDDAIVLKHDGAIIDVVGQVGTDPGSFWGTEPVTTQNHTLRRKDTICAGDTNPDDAFDPATEWDGYPQDDFDDLGMHTADCGGSGGITLSVADVSQQEGDSGTTVFSFVASLSDAAPAGGVSFDIATADGSAEAGSDYVANSVTGASIAEGETSYTFDVAINGDSVPEPDETFTVQVGNISGDGVSTTAASATGSIENDDAVAAEIYEIQGNGATSPLVGQIVSTHDNIVTAVGPEGFFVQTPDARDDGDPLTSNGVYVYTGTSGALVNVGDSVSFDATVSEFFNFTELESPSDLVVNSSANPLPTAVVFDAAVPSPDPDMLSCGDTNFECFEGMRVSIDDGLVTRANQSYSTDPYAEVFISTNGARSLREPGLQFGLTPTPGDNDEAGVWDGNPEIFEMDLDALNPITPPPAFIAAYGADANGALTGGSRFSATGVIAYDFGDYEFWPADINVSYHAPVPRPVSGATAGSPRLRIGQFNVERYCDDQPPVDPEIYPCGGNSDPSTAEVADKTARLSQYIGGVLKLPDVLGVEEVENLSVLQQLANRISLDFGVTYTPQLIDGHDLSGIDVGFLVNQARVHIDQVRQLAADVTWDDPGGASNAYVHDHPPLLLRGTFLGDGTLSQPFMLMVNHLKARFNVEDTGSDGERDREKRMRQAYSVAQQVQDLQTANAGEPLIVIGDFNAYEFTDGFENLIGLITGRYNFAANLVDLSDPQFSDLGASDENIVSPRLWDAVYALPENERYSYLYTPDFGTIQGFDTRDLPTDQVLDHALLNTTARAQFAGMAYGRADEDAADEDEYQIQHGALTGTIQDSIGVSDHDGFVASFIFDRIFADGFESSE